MRKPKRLDVVVDSREANRFLTILGRVRRYADNADEECCNEGCSYNELAEYTC